ncbi:beta-propeller fold lactonase family protein [Akkermansiaceae bacterium]|nr:beta-propeller fold lactonase family protein [Akkermansiaceae bacterium]
MIRSLLITLAIFSSAFAVEKSTQQFVLLSLGKDQKIATFALNSKKGTLTPKSSIDTEGQPSGMAVNQSQTRLYVAFKGSNSIATYDISAEGKLTLLGESMIGEACRGRGRGRRACRGFRRSA